MSTKYKWLGVFVLLGIGIVLSGMDYRIRQYDDRLKAIEKVLHGDKYICGIRRGIKGAWIDCDQLEKDDEQ